MCDCWTASWRGGSTTAVTRTVPTGSTSSRGPTVSCGTPRARRVNEAPVRHGGRRRLAVGAGGPAGAPSRRKLADGARTASGEDEAGAHRYLLRRRFHRAAVGRHRLSATAGELEGELLRMERRGFRLGRGPRGEYPVAVGKWGARWRQSEGDRAAGGHE